MNRNHTPAPRPRRFVNLELLLALVIIAILAASIYGYIRRQPSAIMPRQIATQTKNIHAWLMAYAEEHGGELPHGATSNEAYRQLFKGSLGADEKQFLIPSDAWHGGREPDGDVGSAPEMSGALEPGECAFAYVSGLNTRDTARIPLIANAFTSTPGVWCDDPGKPGGVFAGRCGIVCRLGGSASVTELKEGEWTVTEEYEGRRVNIFTPGFEEKSFTVLNPAEPPAPR